jgi:hypothetical protein
MKKMLLLLLALALVPVFAPARAHASLTLAQRVSRLEAKMSCLQRTPASSYLGYAWYESPTGSVHALTDTDTFTDSFSAVDFGQGLGDTAPPDYWLIAVRNTKACRGQFRVVASPYARPVALRFPTRRLAAAR